MQKHFTATVYILERQKILLIKHPKLGKWLPPGGHLEPNETPEDAAIREAFEETGLHISLISDENIVIDRWNARSMKRPYLCLLETIPAYKDEPAHYHIDMIFLGSLSPKTQEIKESAAMRWFSLDEILTLIGDNEIFIETQEVCKKILKK